jgi:hypothetical protein
MNYIKFVKKQFYILYLVLIANLDLSQFTSFYLFTISCLERLRFKTNKFAQEGILKAE